ncbi:permuted papain-like amidase YaeF/Yiix C92 family enzyme [Aquisalibacillus elongatus]|uniref:Permuted papain-like amidase YaeF/Yiix C92 family enzyme n=2 Tax=Aquisalibacillus elongatus TaxID=485577 RepID=A0A3N5BS21_9BACI|nr:permuted papain-like amidase YaeF/Yiix C92 family enzyme [Aquisalibacillus elongatus]
MSSQEVYIVLSNTGTLFTSLIKTYTRAPYNHASISFDAELHEMYSFGRKNPRNPMHGGFVKEDILTGTYSRYKETTCVIYRLNVTEREKEKMKRILNVFIKNDDKFLYNILGVLGVSFKEPIEFSNSYFCSQFVAEVLQRSGIKLWNKLPAMVTPDDFRKNEQLEMVYEGKLFEFEPIKKQL